MALSIQARLKQPLLLTSKDYHILARLAVESGSVWKGSFYLRTAQISFCILVFKQLQKNLTNFSYRYIITILIMEQVSLSIIKQQNKNYHKQMSSPKNHPNPQQAYKSPFITLTLTPKSGKNQIKQVEHQNQQHESRNKDHDQKKQQMNNFLALKKLRETEQHIKMLKGRFKVLKLKQQSSRAKTIHHENLLKFSEQNTKKKQQHRLELQKSFQQKSTQVQQNRIKYTKFRQQIKQKNRTIKQTLLNDKLAQNRKLREQSLQNDKKYKEIKMEDRKNKVEKRNKIFLEEKNQKEYLNRYKESRVNETKEGKTLDMNDLLEKQSVKQKQLEELMKIEEDLEKDAMNSIQASRILKNKLAAVIQRRKPQGGVNNGNMSASFAVKSTKDGSDLSQSSQMKLPGIGKTINQHGQAINKSMTPLI